MRLLLDTNTFLWWLTDAPQLSAPVRTAIAQSRNECFVSLASLWELAIKVSLGKLEIAGTLERFIPEQLTANAFRELAIEIRHVVRVARLPFHHRDPFDRLLAAQALEEDLTIASADVIFRRYRVKRIW